MEFCIVLYCILLERGRAENRMAWHGTGGKSCIFVDTCRGRGEIVRLFDFFWGGGVKAEVRFMGDYKCRGSD